MKKIFISLLFVFISSCSGTYYNYQNAELRKNISLKNDGIYIKNFNLSLTERRIGSVITADNIKSEYFTTKEMKDFMLSIIKESLKKQNLYVKSPTKNSYQYDISIAASRNFSAFNSNKYVGLNIEKIDIYVYKDNQLFAQKNLTGIKSGIIMTGNPIDCGNDRGLIKNLETIVKVISLQKGVKDEIEDVEYCSNSIYKSMITLGK